MTTTRIYKRKNGRQDREIHFFLTAALYKRLLRLAAVTDLSRGLVLAAGLVLALEQLERLRTILMSVRASRDSPPSRPDRGVHVYLPADLHKRLSTLAIDNEVPKGQLLIACLMIALEHAESDPQALHAALERFEPKSSRRLPPSACRPPSVPPASESPTA